MRRRNGGDDGTMRTDHIDQSGNLTGMVHTQFKDTIFTSCRQTRQRERHADVIVEAALGSMGFARFGQRIGKAGFGAGFADTAGNCNNLRATTRTRARVLAFQSRQHIIDRQQHGVFFQIRQPQNRRLPKPPPLRHQKRAQHNHGHVPAHPAKRQKYHRPINRAYQSPHHCACQSAPGDAVRCADNAANHLFAVPKNITHGALLSTPIWIAPL